METLQIPTEHGRLRIKIPPRSIQHRVNAELHVPDVLDAVYCAGKAPLMESALEQVAAFYRVEPCIAFTHWHNRYGIKRLREIVCADE